MKISLVFLGRLGAGTIYSLEMAKALSIKNKLQIILSKNIENKDVWNMSFKDNENVEICFFNTYNGFLSFLINSLNIFNYFRIINKVKLFNPDAIYYPFLHLWSSILNVFLKKFMKFATVHDVKTHSGENWFFILGQIASIKTSDKLIILNNGDIQNAKNFGFTNNDICVIPHASFSYYKKNEIFKVHKLNYNILFLGRIEKYKGVDLLLDAFFEVNKKMPNINLTIAGNGNLKPYLPKIKRSEKAITVINKWLEDEEIGDLIYDCDFLVLPYIDASQSGIIPLAFGCGKTVIATNVGALSEQVPENTGVVVDLDYIAISDAIISLYDNSEKIFQLGLNASKYALEELSWHKSSNDLVKFFKENIN
jgi:glycosyltransferase involved in cell wall biosynthesis